MVDIEQNFLNQVRIINRICVRVFDISDSVKQLRPPVELMLYIQTFCTRFIATSGIIIHILIKLNFQMVQSNNFERGTMAEAEKAYQVLRYNKIASFHSLYF